MKTKKFPSKKSVEKEMEKLNFVQFDVNRDHKDVIRDISKEQFASKQKMFEK